MVPVLLIISVFPLADVVTFDFSFAVWVGGGMVGGTPAVLVLA